MSITSIAVLALLIAGFVKVTWFKEKPRTDHRDKKGRFTKKNSAARGIHTDRKARIMYMGDMRKSCGLKPFDN